MYDLYETHRDGTRVYVRPETMSECELQNNRAEQWRLVFHIALFFSVFFFGLYNTEHGMTRRTQLED